MKLTPKAVRFVIAALEYYQQYHDERLRREGLSEDEISDLMNDREYLAALKQDFAQFHAELVQQRESVKADA